ncbi:MAG TPA: IclR family transcriptional regulator [Longimicrobiaceae bacterium]|nr:IclR family transcriptional regulator [Longimicrobiaceae bacterium]
MLHKAMEVLHLFTPLRKEVGVTEAAELLGRPKSTVSRWLSAMDEAGFLDRDADSGRYRVSLQVTAVGEMAKRSTSLQQVARPALQRLTTATGETANLVVLVGTEGVNIEAAESPRPVMHMGMVGRRFPVNASAACKAILAWMEEAEVRAFLPDPLPRCTPATVADPDRLVAELAEVRRQGYAVNWQELEEDLVAVAAPVRDHRGKVVAAVSISAPVSRAPRESLPELGGHVAEAARALSADLGWR